VLTRQVNQGVLPNGCVAVKKLLNSKTIDDVLFYRETNFLMSVKHQNIVRFLGYCANTENIAIKVDGSGKCGNYMYPELRERLLCFEYVSKGSLHNHLTGTTMCYMIQFLFLYLIIFLLCFCFEVSWSINHKEHTG
jgi:coatomer subunit beta'